MSETHQPHPGPDRSSLLRTLLTVVILAAGGCRTVVVPPSAPVDPQAVYLIDYGRHTSLLLPAEPSGFVEYAYGGWSWFALDRTAWYDTFGTVLWPTRGALGRRSLAVANDLDAVVRRIPAESVAAIVVAGADVTELRASLAAEYDRNIDTRHYQPRHDLWFVHDDRTYCLFHNCNHVTADWLRALGCHVDGPAIFADFDVCAPLDQPPG